MKIGIIGLGIVGGAIKEGFEKIGHHVQFHDTKYDTAISNVLETEIIFICVPTPQNKDGSCDVSIVDSVINEIVEVHSYSGTIAIKSTVIPGTTKKLQEEYQNSKICFVPEFLRERCAVSDFTELHDLCIVGTESESVFELVKKCHGKYPDHTVKLAPTEAEICKYFNNVYNATLITFANSFYELCRSVGADYDKVKNAMTLRSHITDKYLDCNENLRGFGGMCLPKDISAINAFVNELKLKMKLFHTIIEDNKNYKNTVLKGSRK